MVAQTQQTTEWPHASTWVTFETADELKFWCNKFKATHQELVAAIRVTGRNFKDLETYFANRAT
jgi:Protein of unknown function (DUF3606)